MNSEGREIPLLRDRPEVRDALAAEYALGTLHGAARRRFERWLRQDKELRRRVQAWEDCFANLVEEVEPISPPRRTWQGVRHRIEAESAIVQRLSSLWNSLPLWRGVALVAALLFALTVGWILSSGTQPPLSGRIAVVGTQKADPVWVITVGENSRKIRIRTLRDPPMGPGKVCPLWLRREDSKEARIVGLLPQEKGLYTLSLPRGLGTAFLAQSKLVVSIEPADQMPKDRPSGPVMYRGDWIRL